MALARRLIMSQGVVGVHRPVGQLLRLAGGGAEEGAFLLAGDAGRFDVGVQVVVGVVVGGHLVPLAALLMQAEPGPAAFDVIILDLHAEGGTDAGEADRP